MKKVSTILRLGRIDSTMYQPIQLPRIDTKADMHRYYCKQHFFIFSKAADTVHLGIKELSASNKETNFLLVGSMDDMTAAKSHLAFTGARICSGRYITIALLGFKNPTSRPLLHFFFFHFSLPSPPFSLL